MFCVGMVGPKDARVACPKAAEVDGLCASHVWSRNKYAAIAAAREEEKSLVKIHRALKDASSIPGLVTVGVVEVGGLWRAGISFCGIDNLELVLAWKRAYEAAQTVT